MDNVEPLTRKSEPLLVNEVIKPLDSKLATKDFSRSGTMSLGGDSDASTLFNRSKPGSVVEARKSPLLSAILSKPSLPNSEEKDSPFPIPSAEPQDNEISESEPSLVFQMPLEATQRIAMMKEEKLKAELKKRRSQRQIKRYFCCCCSYSESSI
jgi:uncharacterized small protein (DUF1192 family)